MANFLSSTTKSDLVTYALIGAVSTPIALVGGNLAAAVFCVVAFIIAGIAKRRV